MYLRKKIRKRLIAVGLVIFGIIFFRGLNATTRETHDCEFKILYAVCTVTEEGAEMPGLWNIFKAGVSF